MGRAATLLLALVLLLSPSEAHAEDEAHGNRAVLQPVSIGPYESTDREEASDRDHVVIAFTGDTLIHTGVASAARRNGPPYDFQPMFEGVRHILSRADLAICHLEVPLDPKSGPPTGYPLFNAPAEVAEGLAYAGYDGCSTASNHSFDRGEAGVRGTLEVLSEAGLSQVGMAASPGEAGKPAFYEVGDLTVAHLAATYWINGLRTPADKEWLVQRIDTGAIIEAALRARHDGADLVVVSIHCCTEYRIEPTSAQLELSRKLIGSPLVDLVVTHHSHWVGPVEEIDGEFVLHGLGNFLSGQTHTARTSDGVIALVTAERAGSGWEFTDVRAVPTRVERGTYRIRIQEHGDASYQRTMTALAAMGVETPMFRLPGLSADQMALIE